MIFLWPEPRLRGRSLAYFRRGATEAVEAAFKARFPQGEPVFVSSARAGICLALAVAGAGRAALVRIPPYASHCLVESVARLATPLPSAAQAEAAFDIVYHQWGHVQTREPARAMLFEDACDTLCRFGAALFPAGGRFEFWSLPKIAGCSSGGVVWCRNTDDAAAVRAQRDSRRSGASLQWALRRLGARSPVAAEYWAGRESAAGAPSRIACAEALEALDRWQEVVDSRMSRIALLKACWPSWLPHAAERLPCAVPVREEPEARDALRALGADIGVRHYERVSAGARGELVRTLPVPVHDEVPLADLRRAAAALRST
jgi:putative PLP-dependent aminotransferase (TIGR04422 family)